MGARITIVGSALALLLAPGCVGRGEVPAPSPGRSAMPAAVVAPVLTPVGLAPAPSEGELDAEHPALARARWVTNPVAWTGDGPEFFRPVFDPPSARERSLAARAARRTYDGAPPPLGHAEDFGGSYACLDCHGSGRAIGARIARPMSHQPMGACTQCHVPPVPEALGGLPPALVAVSGFVGLLTPGAGERAYDGAPPSVPHTVQLRVRCLSCHGEFGYEGLRIDHATYAQCIQCHLTQAPLVVARGG